jgi:hypothetical protein
MEREVYDEPTTVDAKDGTVTLDGPDGVDVHITPEAAEETSDRLLEGAMKARGQTYLKDHQAPQRAQGDGPSPPTKKP